MEEITYKRLLRWTLASFIAVVMIAYGFGVGIASAESGDISVSYDSTKTYNTQQSGGAIAVTLYTTIYWDTADYNKINDFSITTTSPYSTSFVHDFESTAFTITSGGTGGGVAWYDKNTSKLYWVFYGSTFQSSPLILSYTTNIWANVSTNVEFSYTISLNANNPLSVGSVAGANGMIGRTYISSMSATTTDHYVVTYPSSGLFTVSVTKGVLDTKHIIHGTVSEYTRESTFNTAPYQFTGNYNDGLYINVTLSNGAYTNVLVNSTNSGMPTPTPTPVINPITGGGIYWDASQYNIGQTGNIVYAFDDNAWYDFLYSKKVEVYDQSDSMLSQFEAGQSGTFPFSFSYSGTYKAKLQKYFLGLLASTYEEDSTVVLSLNNIFTTKSTYTNIENVNIYGNYSGKGKGYLYVGKNLNSPDYKLSVVAGQYNYTLVNLSSGKWDISLLEYDDYTTPDCLGSTGLSSCFHTKASKSFYVTTANQTLSISWDKSEVFTGSSANYNFQNNSGADIIRIYRPDNTIYYTTTAQDQIVNYRNSGTVYFYYDVRNIGVWEARITNASNLSHSVSAFITVKINTGANVTNSYGASMYWGLLQNTPKTNNKLYWGLGTIPTLTPNSVSINIMKVQTNANMKTFVVTADGDQDIYFIAAGIYQAQMLYNNSVIAVSNIEITSGTSITPTPTPITTTPSVSETSNDIVSLFSQKIFWALIFIVGLALMVAKRERKG